MSDTVAIALIGAVVVLVIFIISAFLFRNQITTIQAGGAIGITITMAEKEKANKNLAKAEQEKGHNQDLDSKQNEQAKNRIDELERKLQKTILWVDDNPANNIYEVETLQPLGVQVIQVKSNAEAYKKIEQEQIHLVITDIARDSQKTDGMDLVSTLAEQKPELPTIIYSSFGRAQAKRAEALSYGVMTITSSPSELIQLVIQHLK